MIKIVQKENPVLRKIAKPIDKEDIDTPKTKKVIEKMIAALDGCDDGVAIAAPQIGESLRIFVVSPKIFEIENSKNKTTNLETALPSEQKYLIFINPEIIKKSSRKKIMEEGCLSVRWLYGKIKRHEKVTMTALNEKGEKITRGASGLLAEVFQHEVDHLDGKLFIDSATEIFEMKPEKPIN